MQFMERKKDDGNIKATPHDQGVRIALNSVDKLVADALIV